MLDDASMLGAGAYLAQCQQLPHGNPSGQPPMACSPAGRPLDPAYANVARRTREAHEGKHLSKLMDPADLPQRWVPCF